MRILHTGDWHLGKNLEGISRMDEQEEFLNDFVEIVEENNIDLIMIAGDVYDSSNPPARAEKMFYDTLKRLSKNGERLTLVIAGNHDNPDRLVAAGPLAREHGIIMVGTPKTVVPCGGYGKHKILDSGEGFIEIEINNEKTVILTVPYPSEKRLNEVIYNYMEDEEEKAQSYSEKIFSLFDSLKSHYREDTINLVISHLFAMGSEESGSERSIQLGGTYIVDGNCFPKEAQYIALGHVHKPQVVPGTNKRARYCGSPIHYNKKEINFEKKCYIIEVKAKEECKIEELNLKVYKPIEIWKCADIEDAIAKCEKNKARKCFVYLEIETDRYIREDEIKQMKELKKDILEIMPKIKGTTEEEVDFNLNEKTFEEIFIDFYTKERGTAPEEDVVSLLLSIINEEEGEINETSKIED
ncbi:exonuclease SbcCD subunit D [Clostridium saccharoperbutylacetonicum]|uniref:exonuclease SbcCD subunit D n=1 Tax=Clostridium saccharoperbutylacetonicum TaxID=36745 RepID=UPI0009873ADE|nr:exonuclease SbcCD subunit D [Clostridium saccharoperbutylacetonicum]